MNDSTHIVIFSGAGISAESGLKTFRGEDGLWEGYHVEDVATYDAWKRNPELVLEFYNQRRQSVRLAQPNNAHLAIAKLEQSHRVSIITQNIDDLHERAGSKNILHLHGEILKSQSTLNPDLVYPLDGADIELGDTCEHGSQLRPFIVWFGEDVPNMLKAINISQTASTFIVVGSSMLVYPAASLINYVADNCKLIVVDPNIPDSISGNDSIVAIEEKASTGIQKALDISI